MRRACFAAALLAAFPLSGAISNTVAQIVTTSVSAGGGHSCALTTGGGLKCWGYNFYGQLGVNSSGNWLLTPVDVNGLGSGVVAVGTGSNHTCALTTGGGVKCWGWNSYGQLGDGSTATRLEPVDVVGLTSGVAAISVGGDHSCAITEGGALKCWGSNFFGELGDNTITNRTSPIDVAGLASDVRMVSVGGTHTCALLRLGGVKCWGLNNMGHLGDGTNTQRRTPVDVVGLASGVESIDVGSYHSCAVAAGGALKCWGMNYEGELGNGTTTDSNTPVDVSGLASGVTAVSGGSNATCARLANAGLKCWGWNYYGEVGDGTTNMRTSPVDVSGLTGSSISQGGSHTCALTTGGGVKCWGYNLGGQVGDGSQTETHLPVDVSGLAPSAPGIATQSIVFAAPAASAIDTPLELSATATGGLAVTFDSWTPSVCSVSGTTLTTFALGLCGVRASQAGNASFFPAPQQLRWISIAPPDQFLQIEKQGQGFGVVVGSGIDCGVTCYLWYPYGTVVTLNVVGLLPGSTFAGWSGGGCGGTGSCQVTMTDYALVIATINAAPPHSSFNGDTRSDVFWRDSTGGLNYQWQMNGFTLSGQGYMPSVPSNWAVAGIGDVNGDRIADVLWREAGGLNYLWTMNGLTVASQGYLPTVPNPWIVVGLGDASGDGRADVFWRNPTSGQNYLWIMNGLTIGSQGYLPSVAGPDWEAVGVADYSGDGKADVFWRNKTTGQNYVWVMNGLVVASQGYLTTINPTDWEVVGSPDANGDAKADVLWRNKVTGQNYLWIMNGLAIATQGYLPSVADANWKVVGFGDYNGDSKGDVLWRNATTGQNYLWTLFDIDVATQGYVPSVVGSNWKPVKR